MSAIFRLGNQVENLIANKYKLNFLEDFMIIHMVLFKFEEPVTADFEETVEYHCEQIRQHCEGVILFDLKKNFSDRCSKNIRKQS